MQVKQESCFLQHLEMKRIKLKKQSKNLVPVVQQLVLQEYRLHMKLLMTTAPKQMVLDLSENSISFDPFGYRKEFVELVINWTE